MDKVYKIDAVPDYNSLTNRAVGLPSVAYCARELNLSPGYFGDLVKKETGKTAQEYIQSKINEVAKERIFDQSKSVVKLLMKWDLSIPNILPGCLEGELDITK